MPHEVGQPHPDGRVSGAVHGRLGQRSRPREEVLRLVTVQVQYFRSAPGGQRKPLRPPSGHDRGDGPRARRRRPEQRQGTRAVDQDALREPRRRGGSSRAGPTRAGRGRPRLRRRATRAAGGGSRRRHRPERATNSANAPHVRSACPAAQRLPRPSRQSGTAAGPGHGGDDALAEPLGVGALPHFDHVAAQLVAHRHREGDLRMPPAQQLQVRPAGQRRANASRRPRRDPPAASAGRAPRSGRSPSEPRPSRFPLADETRQVRQPAAAPGQGSCRRGRLFERCGQHLARALDAPHTRKRRLARGGILAGRLSERRGVGFDVEQIVLDLESEPERAPVPVQPLEVLFPGEREDPAERERSADRGGRSCFRGWRRRAPPTAARSPALRGPPPVRRSCRWFRWRRRPCRGPSAWPPRRPLHGDTARAGPDRASAGRRPPEWRSLRRRPRDRSAHRAAGRRCPAPAGRRE